MSIITKTGDGGKSLFLGKRVSKGGVEMEVVGVLDELQAVLMLVKTAITNNQKTSSKQVPSSKFQVPNIIEDLGGIMGELATGQIYNLQTSIFSLEQEIEKIESKLPRQDKFLTFEKEGAGWLNWARTVARRAERNLVKYNEVSREVDPNILIYINRLSDYLFILAREVESNN